MAGGRPELAVMVGDSEVDIATAIAAGVPSIAVTFGYTTVPVRNLNATAVIDHYGEFMESLETALAVSNETANFGASPGSRAGAVVDTESRGKAAGP
jgi:hypothetical protein